MSLKPYRQRYLDLKKNLFILRSLLILVAISIGLLIFGQKKLFGILFSTCMILAGIYEIIKSYYAYQGQYLYFITSRSHQKIVKTGQAAQQAAIINITKGLVLGVVFGIFLFLSIIKQTKLSNY